MHAHPGPGCKTLSTDEQSTVPEWSDEQSTVPEWSLPDRDPRALPAEH